MVSPEPASPEIPDQVLDILEIDHPLGRGDLVLDPADQVGAAGERRGVLAAQELDRVLDARGGSEVKSIHG